MLLMRYIAVNISYFVQNLQDSGYIEPEYQFFATKKRG